MAEALAHAGDWTVAATKLRGDESLEPLVKRAALESLTVRANKALLESHKVEPNRARRTWIARMLALEPWPDEKQIEASLSVPTGIVESPAALNGRASAIVDPDAPRIGEEQRALLFARRAVATATTGPSPEPLTAVAAYRTTLARALHRVGRS